ncbi:MAG TPA: NAD(P)/FAD-dependent oxidoreductase [Candidatus Eisenbacteria bacterium]
MARTPLFDSLTQALRIAAFAARAKSNVPPLDELVDMAGSRRRFLKQAAASAAAAAFYGCAQPKRDARQVAPPPQTATAANPRIVIVGGGMAGLNTAYKLQKAGLTATIYEGSDRTGGRMFTAKDLLGTGITTELGGEFIDSGHAEMLALMQEFGLESIDTHAPEVTNLKKETYFVNGRHYSIAQAAQEFVPLAARIQEHYDSMGEVVDYQTDGGGGTFDRMSIAEYLDSIGSKGWLREVLDVAYVTEYGLEAAEQSSLNFLFLIGTGDLTDASTIELLGESDERFKVKGGNQRVVDELARRLDPQIQRRHRLEAIKPRGAGYTLTFQVDGAPRDVEADIVVLAMPFTLLREVDIQVPLPDVKTKAIRELGYGTNAKVLVGFKDRPWIRKGYSGATYSDEMFQLCWDNSFLQAGTEGGITLYSGGKLGLDAGNGTAEEAAARLMPGFERTYPGASARRNGRTSRFHWPTFPWTKASYACYKPGQWTTIAGAEGVPVGNLFFAGEHCSYDFQGYMNGAAQSGLDTAKAVMGLLSGSPVDSGMLFEREAALVG